MAVLTLHNGCYGALDALNREFMMHLPLDC